MIKLLLFFFKNFFFRGVGCCFFFVLWLFVFMCICGGRAGQNGKKRLV